MTQRLTLEEKAAAVAVARDLELAKRPEAVSIAVYIGDVTNHDGTVTYHAVIRVDATVPRKGKVEDRSSGAEAGADAPNHDRKSQ